MRKNLWSRIVASLGAVSLSSLALVAALPLSGGHAEQHEDIMTGGNQSIQPTPDEGEGEGEGITDYSTHPYTTSNPYATNPTDVTTPVTPYQPPYPETSVYGESNPDTNIRGYVGGGYPGEPYSAPYPSSREGISTSPTAGPGSRSYSTNGSDVDVTTGYGTGGIGTTGSTLSISPNNPTPVTGY